MKKTLLSLLMFLALPLMAQVSNPSIIPVAGAPSGACSQNLPDQQTTVAGVLYTCQNGVWGAVSGGGSSLPSALTGQMLTNTNGSTTYAGQANIIYQQSGDTIASIETACSSPCTYVVTSPQTITLAASHAMNSNVWLRFEADGKWTVNGSTYVLSNVQVAPGTTTTAHFPAGSGSLTLSTLNTLVPVEWFGAVGDWNGTTGTNNLTAIQNAVNATTYGQVQLQSLGYAIGGTLNFTASYVGMRGTPASGGLSSYLMETVAGDTAVSEVGSSGTYLIRNVFEYFSVYSSVAQTGTTAGMLFSFTGGVTVQNVSVNDFFHDFSIHASPSYGNGGFFHDNGGWTSLSSAMTNPVAFYLPSTDGVAENSINLNYDSAAVATGGPTQPIGLLSTGTAINDQDITNFATAGINGMEFIYTGSGATDSCSDIQIVTPTIDNFPSIGVEVSGCPPAASGRVAVSGGYIMAGPSTVSTNGAVYVLNSSGFTIYGTQIGVIAPGTAATYGVNFSGSGTSGGIASNVTCMNQPNCVYWQANANNNSATGNVAINETGSAYAVAFHVGSGSSYNQISANTTVGLWTDGLILDSGVTNNTYGLNNWSSGTTTSVSDSGTRNGFGSSISIYNPTTTGGATLGSFLYPSLANASTAYPLCIGTDTSATNDCLLVKWHYVSTTSASNYGGLSLGGAAVAAIDIFGNSGAVFGETTPAVGPANGIAVGTTGQATIDGSGNGIFTTVEAASARKGTFVCTNGGTITIANTNELVTSDVIISMNTAGGTITTPPAMKTVTSGTGFTVLCGATDTSTYNYTILN